MANALTDAASRAAGDGQALAELPDDQLLVQFLTRANDRAEPAFAELVRRYGPMVLGTCRQWLRDAHDADDAFQATFLILARKARSIRRPELLGPWLYGVAVRVARKAKALNERRSRHEKREAVMWDAEPIGDLGQQELGMVRREEIEALHEELARLPEKYRLPIVLCDLEGLTHREAATRLRWPAGSLSVRLMRARRLLHTRLTRRGLAPTAALLVTAVFGKTTLATVPPSLAHATIQAGLHHAGGGALGVSVSSSVSALTGHVLASMARAKVAIAGSLGAAGLAAVATALAALGSWERDRAVGHPPTQASARPVPESPVVAIRPSAPVDKPNVASDPNDGPPAPTEHAAHQTGPREEREANPRVPDTATTYASLARRAGRDADSQIRLALWCEANGLDAERLKHLALAVLADPGNAAARGLLGQVAYDGRWRRAESVGELVHADTRLASALESYAVKRRKTPNTAEAHWKLALWCEQQDLKAEAAAHLVAVTRLAPDHEAAWKRLGRKRSNGRWLTEAQIATERDESNAQREGNRRWKPLLTKWQAGLGDRSRRAEAEKALAGVTDPYAAQAVWEVFAIGGPSDQNLAVQIFGQIDASAATAALAVLAISSPTAGIRKAACETLARRDARVAIGLLVGLLRDPLPNPNTIFYRFQYVPIGALGAGSPGINVVETRQANLVRVYTVDEVSNWPLLQLTGVNTVSLGPYYEARIAIQRSRQMRELEQTVRQAHDEAAREVFPLVVAAGELNARATQALRNITGEGHGQDWAAWKRWWVENRGYAYDPEQDRNPPDWTFFQAKPTIASSAHFSCFAAGTPVMSLTGPRAIETIRTGDQVLTQSTDTGALRFEPVLAAYHNAPAPTVRIRFTDTAIVATGIHRFWKPGQGWIMARDLKPGDAVRTLGGLAHVTAVAADRVQPVFNLEVSAGQSFFAGSLGALVHDNSTVEPVRRPFDGLDESTGDDLP